MAQTAGRWCQLLHPQFVNNHGSLMDTLQNIQCHRFARGKCFLPDCRRVHLPLASMMTRLRDTESNMVFHVRPGRVLPINVPDAANDIEIDAGASIAPTQPDSPAAPRALFMSPTSATATEVPSGQPEAATPAPAAFTMPPWHDGHDWRAGFRGDFLRSMDNDLNKALRQAKALRDHFNPDLPCFFGAQLNCYASDIYDVMNDECFLLQARIAQDAAEKTQQQQQQQQQQDGNSRSSEQ